jgi:predicted ATPase
MRPTLIEQWRRSCTTPDNDGVDEELIGRQPEQAQLNVWVSETLSGRGSLVLIGGEAGVGKTTLAKRALAGSGLQILEGLAVQGGTSPFGPVVEALRSYLRAAGETKFPEGPLVDHLALLLPELGPAGPAGDRATLFEAIRQALATIGAQRPTALFLDDLQWADDATSELLGALARSLDSEPLLLLGAFRSADMRCGGCAASCGGLPGCGR